jgi:hypothetical protein
MLVSWDNEQVLAMSETLYDGAQDTIHCVVRNRESECFPYGNTVFSPVASPFDQNMLASQSASTPRKSRLSAYEESFP